MTDDARIVFVNGHELDRCDLHFGGSCDCAERYEDIFGRCYECGEELDKYRECPSEDCQ